MTRRHYESIHDAYKLLCVWAIRECKGIIINIHQGLFMPTKHMERGIGVPVGDSE